MVRRFIAGGLLVFLLGSGCDLFGDEGDPLPPRGSLTSPTTGNERVIALVGTLSGPDAWRGDDAYEGAEVAVRWLNRNLASGERPFALGSVDDEGDARKALQRVEELAADEDTVGIVYAGPPGAIVRAEPALVAAGIPAMVCYGDLYFARRLEPHIFQMAPPLPWGARRVARYTVRDREYERIGVLAGTDLDGRMAVRSLRGAYNQFTGFDPVVARYRSGDPKLRGALGRLKRRRAEAVIVQGSPATFAAVMQELRAMKALYRGTQEARITSARSLTVARRRLRRDHWRPQVIAFDQASFPAPAKPLPPGTIAVDTYARGAHYLPIPSLVEFREAFQNWWGELPLGFERRAYEATRIIGWAAREGGNDLARRLETLRDRRFGGLDVTFGPDDHTAVGMTTIGLWVVPRPGTAREARRLPDPVPWVPLARGFSIDGTRTDILPIDWKYMFTNPPPRTAPAPRLSRARFGVRTSASDPVH